MAFDIQAYQNAITEESDADGNIIIYSDGEGNKNNSRLKAEITIPEFGDPILKYAYSDDKFTFRLGALNESLRDANYDIVVSNSNGELCFDSMGNFVNTGLTKDNYESLISASGMTTNTDNGTQIAEISLNENEVINNSLWCFGRVSVNSGVDNDERVFNTLKECNFIKTFKNTLSFTLEKVSLFNGVTFNNCYVRNGNYKIYEQTEDGDIKQIDNPYSKMVLKNYDYGDNVLTVKTNEKNKYRYGDVMVWEINDNPIDTVAKVITCEPKEVYFTQNEIDDKDTVYKVVFTYLKNATMSELELLDGDINDTTNEFSLVIAAKQGNQILAHTLLKDSPEMELTYDELTQLTSFEILFVANYNGIKDTGGSADKDEVLNP